RPGDGRAFSWRRVRRGSGPEGEGPGQGGRLVQRFEAPVADRVQHFAVEGAARLRGDDADVGDAAVGTDGDLDGDLAGDAGTIGRARVGRLRRAYRDRGGAARLHRLGHDRRGRLGGGRRGGGRARGARLGGRRARRRLGGGRGSRGGGAGGLLGGTLGGQLLLTLALGLAGLLLGDALVDRRLALGDGIADARQGRGLRVGTLDQVAQTLGLDEILAADGLLGGDDGVGHQVDQGALGRGIRLVAALAQGQVVLHGVVAGRRVPALLAQGLAAALAQLFHRQGRQGRLGFGSRLLGGDLFRGRAGRLGRGGALGAGSVGRLVLGTGGQTQDQGKGQRPAQAAGNGGGGCGHRFSPESYISMTFST